MSLRPIADQIWLEEHDGLLRHAPDIAELHLMGVSIALCHKLLDQRLALEGLVKAWQENYHGFYNAEELEKAMQPAFDKAIAALEKESKDETTTNE